MWFRKVWLARKISSYPLKFPYDILENPTEYTFPLFFGLSSLNNSFFFTEISLLNVQAIPYTFFLRQNSVEHCTRKLRTGKTLTDYYK